MALRVAAIGWGNRQIVVVVDVAQIAGHVGMPARQQEPGRAVVKRCRRPTDRRMARRAVCSRKSRTGRRMDRIIGLLPGGQMASGISAIGRSDRQIIVIVYMTKGAGHVRVAIGQQKTGRAVVELGVEPVVKGMAARAVRGCKCSSGRWMRRIRRFLPIRQVAGRAGRRKPQIISDRRVCMAFLALHYGVRAEQRESVEVLLNRLDRRPPSENRVALSAVRAKLSAVDVGVTIGAIFANVRENRLGVASRAGHFFVHAAKRVPRGVVIEFGNGANGSPASVGVAILAGNI
jgi:hypothetical protein